jgi:aldehyde:ferredoxin oxidoreductase
MGRRREDDTFNEYYFKHPDRRGKDIDRQAWETVKDEYYQIRGWDTKTGIPTRKKLEELDLRNVADDLIKPSGLEPHEHG